MTLHQKYPHFCFSHCLAATRQGYSAEEIADQYGHLNLAQIYSALAWYHANRAETDADIFREEAEYERLAAEHSRLALCA